MLIESNSVYSHNSFFVENDITSYYQDGSLWDRITGTNGYLPMEGIYPGCYFDISRNIVAPRIENYTTGIGSKRILVLGCNFKMRTGISSEENYINYKHIVCCPYSAFGSSVMNKTDTSAGGYWNTFINQEVIGPVTSVGDIGGTINQQLYAEFGDHLKTIPEFVSTVINENVFNYRSPASNIGVSSGGAWKPVQACLMTEIEVLGSVVFGSSGYDIGNGNKQYPAFNLSGNIVNDNNNFWLRDVVSKERFAFLGMRSQSAAANAYANGQARYFVRPKFVLG